MRAYLLVGGMHLSVTMPECTALVLLTIKLANDTVAFYIITTDDYTYIMYCA